MSEPIAPQPEEEPLYTDERGVPMLFDVVVPGDYLRAAGVFLGGGRESAGDAAPLDSAQQLQARIEAAIDAALPAATAAIRETVLAELHKALSEQPPPAANAEPAPPALG